MIGYRIDTLGPMPEDLERRSRQAFDRLVRERREGIAGYYDLPKHSAALVERVRRKMAEDPLWREAERVVVMGVGGSSLGAKAVDRALRSGSRELIFLENPDPVELGEKLARIDRERSLFLLISKSGGTIETLSIFKVLAARLGLEISGGDAGRIAAITDEGSVLHRFAEERGIETFTIPANVGGRFSVLSAVGIVPLTLAGYATEALLEGGSRIVDSFFGGTEAHLLHKAVWLAEHRHRHPMNVLFAYGSGLEEFSKWYIQLWGESLGKIDRSGERVGLTPLGHIGSVDQHSFLQLIMEGPRDKTVTFLKVKDFGVDFEIPPLSLEHLERTDYVNGHTIAELLNAECDATMASVTEEGIPVDSIVLDRLDAAHLGELILYYELLTSLTGALLDVDTYNQPGVERGKKILTEKFRSD